MRDTGDLADELWFSDTEDSSVDDKGRLLVVKRKRDQLGESFILAQSEVGAIAAYPKSTWEEMMRKIRDVPMSNLGKQQYGRLFISTAVPGCNFDNQGRVVIPARLRDKGKIVDKVVVVGNIDRVELWAKSEFEAWNDDPENYGKKRIEAIARAMELMGVM